MLQSRLGRRQKAFQWENGGHSRKWQQHPKVLRKNFPPRVHRLEDLPGSCPHPQLSPRQHWWQSLPLPPTHLRLHIFPADLFSFSDAAADHFNLILPQTPAVAGCPDRSGLGIYSSLSRTREPASPQGWPFSFLLQRAQGVGGWGGRNEGGQDCLLGMFLIPKTATTSVSVHVGLPAQALFMQTRWGGGLHVLGGGSCQVWLMEGTDRGRGGCTPFLGGQDSPNLACPAKTWKDPLWAGRDQNSDLCF